MVSTLQNALDLHDQEVISLVGGGGKTTVLYWLAKELYQQGVILTTTTKMKCPSTAVPLVCWGDRHQVQEELRAMLSLQKTPLVANGFLPQQKIQGLELEQIRELVELELAGTIVIEADGAKGRSLKGYGNWEPVLTPLTTLLIQVVGVDIIGQQLQDRFVHRPQKIVASTGLQLGATLDVEAVAAALLYPYAAWQHCLVKARRVIAINKVETIKERAQGELLATRLLDSGLVDKVLLTAAGGGQVVALFDVHTGSGQFQ